MNEPLISVVIPVYNRASMLATALHSVLAQTFKDFEIIVVDDGSSDDVAATLAEFDPTRIKLVKHAQNKGAGAARNTGIREACGRYIAFLDSDDVWVPQKIARQLAAMETADERTKACCTSYIVVRDDGARNTRVNCAAQPDWYEQMLLGCYIGPGTTLLVERSCFEEIGYFDEDMRRLEDWDWMLRYTSRYSLATVNETLAKVYPNTAPSGADVLLALAIIRQKHLAAVTAGGRAARRRFLSALLLEESALWYRRRRLLRAVATLVRSYAKYPFRRLSFYSNILQKLAAITRWRKLSTSAHPTRHTR